MDEYIFCDVSLGSKTRTYCYLGDENYAIGDIVYVPTGEGNETAVGQIRDIKHCNKENAPYPIEKTKHIIKTLTSKQIDELPRAIKRWLD